MKKKGLVIATGVVLVVATLGSFAFAQRPSDVKSDDVQTVTSVPASGQPAVVAQGMMKGSGMNLKCRMGSMMGSGFEAPSMVALPDGSIIVIVGTTLIKYDSSLNLVKEVKIKVDLEAKQKEIDDLMKDCPQGMMGAFGGGNFMPMPPAVSTDVPKRR